MSTKSGAISRLAAAVEYTKVTKVHLAEWLCGWLREHHRLANSYCKLTKGLSTTVSMIARVGCIYDTNFRTALWNCRIGMDEKFSFAIKIYGHKRSLNANPYIRNI